MQKKGNSDYILFPKKLKREYNILTNQILDGLIELRDTGISLHLDVKQSTILERDTEWLARWLDDYPKMPRHAILNQFNPEGKNKKVMELRLKSAYENIVRRDEP